MPGAGDCILRDHAVVHVVGQEDRRRSRSPPQPRRQSHLPPSRFHAQHVWWKLNTCGLGSRVLRPNRSWQPSDRVKLRFPSSVTSTVVHEAEQEWHINRCSPSRDHRSARWSYISMYPCCRLHGSSASSSRFLQFLGGARNNLELARNIEHRDSSPTLANLFSFVRELIEVILLQPL